MVSFRGDAWKFYLKLEKTKREGKQVQQLDEMKELEKIENFYETLDDTTLTRIRYRMLKEKQGSGTIPIFVSTIPWLLFIFSKQLQTLLFKEGSYLWIGFIFLYLTALTISVIIHFRENAWASVHTEMIEVILKKRNVY